MESKNGKLSPRSHVSFYYFFKGMESNKELLIIIRNKMFIKCLFIADRKL